MVNKHVKKISNLTNNQVKHIFKGLPFLFIRQAKIKQTVKMSTKTTFVSVDQRVGKWTLLRGMSTGQPFEVGKGAFLQCLAKLYVYMPSKPTKQV